MSLEEFHNWVEFFMLENEEIKKNKESSGSTGSRADSNPTIGRGRDRARPRPKTRDSGKQIVASGKVGG